MSDDGTSKRVRLQVGSIAAGLIVLAFVVLVVAKAGSGATVAAPGAAVGTESASMASGPSQSHADAMAAYDAALASGKPIYLLFHSLTCDPCIAISAVVDRVMPDYQGKVVFVNAITTDEPSRQLVEKFRFQYIPQSFFLDPKGSVVESYTGAMDEPSLRAYLDELATR